MRRSVRRRNHMWRRVFGAELKRLLKTRSVLILMAAAVVLAPVLAYFPASFASYTYRDDSGRAAAGRRRQQAGQPMAWSGRTKGNFRARSRGKF